MDAFEAFLFIYNHPRAIEEEPEHPILEHYEKYDKAAKEVRYRWFWNGQFIHNLDILYVKVNPDTNSIDVDESLNTKVRVWLETGPAYWNEYSKRYDENMHDYRLDCGGDTFEEALIKLAGLIKEYYGDYEPELK